MIENKIQLLDVYLNALPENCRYRSTFRFALSVAIDNEYTNPIISLSLYLTCLEQLGNVFCKDNIDNSGIIKILNGYYNDSITDKEMECIDYLHQSLSHNLSLVYDENHKFDMDFSETDNKTLLQKTEQDTYRIYVYNLMKAIKDILKNVNNDKYSKFIDTNEKTPPDISEKYFVKTKALTYKQFNDIEKLYHFTKFETAKLILQSKYLKFGELKRMNDINESFRLILCYSVQNGELVFDKDKANNANDELKKYKQISFTQDGVFKGYSIPSMWGHYAENGKGVCLVFDKTKLLDYLPNDCDKKDISYSKEYTGEIEIDYDITDVAKFFKERKEDLFFNKTKDWEHEQEFRILSQNNDVLYFKDSLIAIIFCFANDIENNKSVFKSNAIKEIKKMASIDTLLLQFCYNPNGYMLSVENNLDWNILENMQINNEL